MKIYSIALFLIFTNLSISMLVATNILPVEIATIPIDVNQFKSATMPENLTYSNADIAMYIFGDFPRAIGMISKILIFAPVILILMMYEAGMPSIITSILICGTYIVYAAGILQFLGKWSLEGNA